MSKNKEDEFEITDKEIFREEEEKEIPIEGEIIDASNFDELYDLIEQKKTIIGSRQTYKARYLIAMVKDFRRTSKKLIETATKGEPFKKTNLLEVFDELLRQLGKITKKKELRFKALQLSLREIKQTK